MRFAIGTILLALAAIGCGGDDSTRDQRALKADLSDVLGGELTLAGRVELPAPSQDRGVQIGLIGHGTLAHNLGETAGQSVIDYELRGIPAGSYRFLMRVDQVDDAAVGGPGDFQGYYAGSLQSPMLEFEHATPIELSTSRFDVDFGLATLP